MEPIYDSAHLSFRKKYTPFTPNVVSDQDTEGTDTVLNATSVAQKRL